MARLQVDNVRATVWNVWLTVCVTGSPWAAQEIAAADRPAFTSSRLTGTPFKPEPYRLVPAFDHLRFEKPTSIEEIPGSKRLVVTEMAGKVFSFAKDRAVRQADPMGDLVRELPAELRGQSVSLFDAELHPKYPQQPYMYLCYVHPGQGGHTRVSRFTLHPEPAPQTIAGSERVVITWPAGGHNGGCLEFGTDGMLYIATGDGTGPNPPDGLTTGQDVSDLLGAILRLDVDSDAGERGYMVPSDNPFVGQEGACPEIWAYGLRNPWKFGVDRESGEMFAADNGWESWEMVHRIVRGGNCGWPVMEGRVALRSEVQVGPTPILPPVMDHPHTEANSVIGGPVYRGSRLPDLDGSFIYGDYITGTIWAIHPERDGAYSCTTLVDTDQRIIAFTLGSEGEVFVLDYDFTGQIYELRPTDQPDRSAEFPRRLSETGLFSSLDKMEPAAGVVPYEVRVNRWMDGAEARRWVAIPGKGKICLGTTEGEASYPDGTVLVKHLALPNGEGRAIPLETQLLHFESGIWRPYSYLWDESQQDAVLVAPTGAQKSIRMPDPSAAVEMADRTWYVSATNECKLCHDAGARYVLGFRIDQLQRQVRGGSAKDHDQVVHLTAQGVLADMPTLPDGGAAPLVDPWDVSKPLEHRARSYLHANCAMCHHPGGNAIVSFYLRRDLPFEQLNTNKGTGIGTFGMSGARIIVPGDPYRSVLFYRMSKLGYARMPYIGSHVVDSAGVLLLEEWIRSLPRNGSAEASAPANPDSLESRALRALASKEVVPPAQRTEWIQHLLKTTEGALALTAHMHRRALSSEDAATVLTLGSQLESADVRGLLETFLPESQRRKTLGVNFPVATVLGLMGDRERGKLIYFSDGTRCRTCHAVDNRAESLGPTLREINKKYSRSAELLQHVVQPSLRIDDPYATYTIATDDGKVWIGLFVEQTSRDVAIKTTEKQVVRIPRSQIEEMRKSEASLMPERLLSDMTAQQAADLLEYVRSLGAAD